MCAMELPVQLAGEWARVKGETFLMRMFHPEGKNTKILSISFYKIFNKLRSGASWNW